jgi:hypothetical protein
MQPSRTTSSNFNEQRRVEVQLFADEPVMVPEHTVTEE